MNTVSKTTLTTSVINTGVMNPKHFIREKPCTTCGGNLFYKHCIYQCVACSNRRNKARSRKKYSYENAIANGVIANANQI